LFLSSCHKPSSDQIYINDSQVGGAFGDFTVAHEYGHALHEKGLGGNGGSGQCPDEHRISGAYNMQCAYYEGFADYHANVVNFPYFGFNLESNSYYRGCIEYDERDRCTEYASTIDGAIVEGAVASFLYDLTDPANESKDDLDYSGQYVAEIIKTCDVYNYYSWTRANGVDHLIACFENRIPNYDFSFSTRSLEPTNYREQATEPTGWDYFPIRKNWNKNLYDRNVVDPPSALLSNESATYTGEANQGTEPYTYKWYVDGNLTQTK
jgi:hypothetical protein